MKNLTAFIFFALLTGFAFAQCSKEHTSDSKNGTGNQPKARPYKRSFEELVKMAEKRGYLGYADMYYGKTDLLILKWPESEVELHLTRDSAKIREGIAEAQFVKAGSYMQCLSDYYNALDKYPQRIAKYYPETSSLEKEKQVYLSSNYRFFINTQTVGRMGEPNNPYPAFPFLVVVKPGEVVPDYSVREIEKR
jgi:hypothetical protein